MSFLIDFETKPEKLKALESSIDAIAAKATLVSKALQGMSNTSTKALTEPLSPAKKLKEEIKQGGITATTTAKSYDKLSVSAKKAANSMGTGTGGLASAMGMQVRTMKEVALATAKAKQGYDLLNMSISKNKTVSAFPAGTGGAGTALGFGAMSASAKKNLEVQKAAWTSSRKEYQAHKTRLNAVQERMNANSLKNEIAYQKRLKDRQVSGFAKLSKVQKEVTEANKKLSAVTVVTGTAHQKAAKGVKEYTREVSASVKASRRAAQEAAALRAMLNAVGTHMGIFTGQTILLASAVYGTVSAFKAVITTGTAFTGEMARAIPIMGATAGQAQILEAEVRRLGATTVFTATEAAGGLTALAMAGLSSTQALQGLAPALALASIGQIDMYQSADILTNVMNGFRLTAEDVPRIVDDLATAITSSNANIVQMSNALSYVAPVAQAAGGSIEEVTAILEVFHNAGIKSSRAGTSLRRAFSNLMSPSAKAVGMLKELGIVTKDSNGYLLEMTDVMKQLAEKGALASDIITLFGVRAAPAMLALLQDLKGVSSEFEMFRANLEANEGAAETLREAMEQHLGADARKLVSALTDQAIELFKHLEEGLRSTVQGLTSFVSSISADDIKKLAENFKAVGSALLYIGEKVALAAKLYIAVKAARLLAIGLGGLVTGYKLLTHTVIRHGVAMSTADALLQRYTARTVAAAGATTAFGAAVKLALGPVGLILTVLSAGYIIWDHYADSTENATDKIKKLTEAQLDQLKIQEEAQKGAKASLQYVAGGGGVSKDRTAQELQKQIKAQQDKLIVSKQEVEELKALWVKDFANMEDSSFGETASEKIANYDKAMQLIATRTKDTSNELKRLKDELDNYLATGIDAQGLRNIARGEAQEASLMATTFNKTIEETIKDMKGQLKNLAAEYKTGSKSAAEVLLGSEEDIAKSRDAITAEFKRREALLKATLKATGRQETKQGVLGGYADIEDHIAAEEKLIKLKEDHAAALAVLGQQVDNTSNKFDTYLSKSEKLLATGEREVANIQAQIDQLNGIKTVTESVTQAKLKAQLAQTGLNIISLEGVEGKEAELAKLKEQLVTTSQLITETVRLQGVLSETKTTKEAEKFLSKEDKAQLEYDKGIAALEAHGATLDGMYQQDEWYVEAKIELDKKLMDSQHETWASIRDASTQAISENLTQALMMQESWHDTGKNIKKAILSSIVSSLVTMGTEMASNALMSALFKEQEIVMDNAVTTNALINSAAVTSAKSAEFSTDAAAAIANQGGGDPYSAFGRVAAMTALMVAVPAVVSNLMGREIGGPVSAGQSYIVGERGAEIFTPTTSGAITSNADVKRKAFGETESKGDTYNSYHTENNYIDAIDTQSFDQRLAKSGKTINRINDKQNRDRGIASKR